MKLAIIGSGISGLYCAHALHGKRELELFEAGSHVGGHTHTANARVGGQDYAVGTGFIVHNDRNYPRFTRLMSELGVETRPTEMSFSLSSERSGIEYSGSSLFESIAGHYAETLRRWRAQLNSERGTCASLGLSEEFLRL